MWIATFLWRKPGQSPASIAETSPSPAPTWTADLGTQRSRFLQHDAVPGTHCLRAIPNTPPRTDLARIECPFHQVDIRGSVLRTSCPDGGTFGPLGRHDAFPLHPSGETDLSSYDHDVIDVFCPSDVSGRPWAPDDSSIVRRVVWRLPASFRPAPHPESAWAPELLVVLLLDALAWSDLEVAMPMTMEALRGVHGGVHASFSNHTTVGHNSCPNLGAAYCNTRWLDVEKGEATCGCNRSVFDDAAANGYNVHTMSMYCRGHTRLAANTAAHEYSPTDYICPSSYPFNFDASAWTFSEDWSPETVDKKKEEKERLFCSLGGRRGRRGVEGVREIVRELRERGSRRDVVHLHLVDPHVPLRDTRWTSDADEAIAELIAGLDDSGVLERSVVVLHSDHGPHYDPDVAWDVRALKRHVHAVLEVVVGNDVVAAGGASAEALAAAGSGMTSAVDVYHTLSRLVGRPRESWRYPLGRFGSLWDFSKGMAAVVDRYDLLMDVVPAERSCHEAGVFEAIFCNCFVMAPVTR